MPVLRTVLIWGGVTCAIAVPILAAAASPLLAWRDPVYIGAGFAGIVAMALLLVQPLLALGTLPGLSGLRGRRVHRRIGWALVAAVVLHVAGLWITSPPDVIDALFFTSPTLFSPFGVIAMWAVFAAAALSMHRRRLRLRTWRIAHGGLAALIVIGSVVHALLIQGTMNTLTKVALCAVVLVAASKALWDLSVRVRLGRLR